MPPLSLAILASVLHMHGADATITSDNKGIEDLLSAVRSQLQEQADSNSGIIKANYSKGYYTKAGYSKGNYGKQFYTRTYSRYGEAARPGLTPAPTRPTAPIGNRRR
jgi:hypothetical protein